MAEHRAQGQKLAIAGGGISGLSAAYYALKSGVSGSDIDIYEATGRLGGKIESASIDGKVVNKGAEFVDSEHTKLIELCNELGIKLDKSTDQGALAFQRHDGSRMSEEKFFAAYKPIADQIIRHKAIVAAEPEGPLAQKLNSMSLNQYMGYLRDQAESPPRSFLHKFFDMLTFNHHRVHPEVIGMVKHAYASESGQHPSRISALQFVHEHSGEPGELLASDCAYRVNGGTERIIDALREKLAAQGVNFHQNAKVTRVSKENGKVQLDFEGGQKAASDKVIMALPAYELGKVDGLTSLGLAPEAQQLIGNTQYTNNLKFTVKLKSGVAAPNSNFFANGFQCWSADPEQLTFLCNADAMKGMTVPQYLKSCMDDYARAHNTSAEAMFDTGPGKIVLTNPGRNPCYASPAPNQVIGLERLGGSMDTLAGNGIAIAGTFLPHRNAGGVEIGFMECGVNASQLACDHLLSGPEQAQVPWVDRVRAQSAARQSAMTV